MVPPDAVAHFSTALSEALGVVRASHRSLTQASQALSPWHPPVSPGDVKVLYSEQECPFSLFCLVIRLSRELSEGGISTLLMDQVFQLPLSWNLHSTYRVNIVTWPVCHIPSGFLDTFGPD